TSENGESAEMRRSPPVFHLRRLSCTLPSHGFRNRPQGSQADRGMTVTAENSSCAFFGRSPPRRVWTRRIISPRFSKPFSISGRYTRCESNGLVATNKCPPGTRMRNARWANSEKNCFRLARSSSERTVNRGRGLRVHPSNEGGMRQTPPRPLRSFSFSTCEYSFSPYGGSVTMAWTELAGRESIHSMQSVRYRL